MSKSKNYYRRMFYKMLAKKQAKQVELYNEFMQVYASYIITNNSIASNGNIPNIRNIKASVKYGADVPCHWFDSSTIKAIYSGNNNCKAVETIAINNDIDKQIIKDRNKKAIKGNIQILHKAKSIVNKNPILYDRSIKINDCRKYKLA